MAKIETYISDNNISDKDVVLGSDGDLFKKTKNYTVGGLKSYITSDFSASEQNNIPKSINLGIIDNPNTNISAPQYTADSINSLPLFVVNSDEIYFFTISVFDNVYVYTFKNIGKGSYGIGNTQINQNQLQLISKRSLASTTIEDETTTDIFNLGNIDPLNISEAVNNINPPIDIQPLSNGFTIFKSIEGGINKSYVYRGQSGLTGVGANQTVLSDFDLIPSEDISVPTLQQVVDESDDYLYAELPSGSYIEDDGGSFTIALENSVIAFGQNGYLSLNANYLTIKDSQPSDEGKILKVNAQGHFELDVEATGYTSADFDADLATKTTDDLAEGLVNFYATGDEFQLSTDTLDDVLEGTTNKHFTNTDKAKVDNLPADTNAELALKQDKRTNKSITTSTYTLLASDVDKFLEVQAPCSIVVPNGLSANLEFQGVQVGGNDTDVIEFVAESGGTLNVPSVFQNKTENEHCFWGIRTFGSDVARLLGTLKLAE